MDEQTIASESLLKDITHVASVGEVAVFMEHDIFKLLLPSLASQACSVGFSHFSIKS